MNYRIRIGTRYETTWYEYRETLAMYVLWTDPEDVSGRSEEIKRIVQDSYPEEEVEVDVIQEDHS